MINILPYLLVMAFGTLSVKSVIYLCENFHKIFIYFGDEILVVKVKPRVGQDKYELRVYRKGKPIYTLEKDDVSEWAKNRLESYAEDLIREKNGVPDFTIEVVSEFKIKHSDEGKLSLPESENNE